MLDVDLIIVQLFLNDSFFLHEKEKEIKFYDAFIFI